MSLARTGRRGFLLLVSAWPLLPLRSAAASGRPRGVQRPSRRPAVRPSVEYRGWIVHVEHRDALEAQARGHRREG